MLISTTTLAETFLIVMPGTIRLESAGATGCVLVVVGAVVSIMAVLIAVGFTSVTAAAQHVSCRDTLPSYKAGSGKKDDLPHCR
jgi:hypothetical protein